MAKPSVKTKAGGLNPLKRVNSILTLLDLVNLQIEMSTSQSPQTGQFNSYGWALPEFGAMTSGGLNPLKRVNSILTFKSMR